MNENKKNNPHNSFRLGAGKYNTGYVRSMEIPLLSPVIEVGMERIGEIYVKF